MRLQNRSWQFFNCREKVLKSGKGIFMKKILKNMLLAFLILTIVCILCPVQPSAASTRKCYTISSGNTTVYSNIGLTKRYGTIYGSDEIRVVTVTSKYTKVTYPVSGGRTKTGYIRTSQILLGTGGYTYQSRAKIETYKRPSGASYGYISSGDRVVILGKTGSYTQVKYPINGGYKYAFISTENANKYLYGSSISYAPYNGVNYTNQGLSAARVAALDKAKRMVTIQWTAPCDFPTWASKSGGYNRAVATDGISNTKFVKGKTYIGIPYSMTDHTYNDVAWANLLKKGISQSSMTKRYSNYPVSGTAKGIDCSYFVYEAIKGAVGSSNIKYQTTSEMLNSRYYKKINRGNMKPGDVFLKSGHVMMYVGMSGNRYAVFEADANDSKCSYNTYSSSNLSSYGSYRYVGFSD